MSDFYIRRENVNEILREDRSLGRRHSKGLVERPAGRPSMGASFGDTGIDILPRESWSDILADQIRTKSRISDLRSFDALDQNGQGFCWAYSSTAAMMLQRDVQGLPSVRLSPHAVACKIYDFQDRGAWSALSFDFLKETGAPPDTLWPQKSMSRRHDSAETWEAAESYRITEGFIDIDASHPADAALTFDQVATLLLSRIPAAGDFYWWGHAVALMDLVEVDASRDLYDPERWGVRILNSWGTRWKANGTSVLVGQQAIPNGACAPRQAIAA